MDDTNITSEIVKEYGLAAGANVVGIASAKDFDLAPDGFKPTDVLVECKSVIVLGATFSPEVLNDIEKYTKSRNEMIGKMTSIAKDVAKLRSAVGYQTKAITPAAVNG